jgi:uncharacterized membrane protein YjgN (DUF898 family)
LLQKRQYDATITNQEEAMTTATMIDAEPFDDTSAQAPAAVERIAFIGSGGEYFRIWIVNLLLTIVTLGIYSAWAKVRRAQYFYGNTQLAGSSFEYHGNPVAILKGRIVAVLLFGGYNIAFQYSLAAGFGMLAVLAILTPLLLWKSLQFKLYNASYRGIRFGFRGSAGRAYLVYLLLPLLAMVTAGLLWPLAHQRMKKFQHDESRFGATYFSFHGSAGRFYAAYLTALGVLVGGFIVIGLVLGGTLRAIFTAGGPSQPIPQSAAVLLLLAALYAWTFTLFPLLLSLLQNLVWNNTRLGPHRFDSNMKWTRATFITLTNIVAIVLTLGLFIPFAYVRMMKYRLESISMTTTGSLDHFIAVNQADAGATGEGMADLLDLDISL